MSDSEYFDDVASRWDEMRSGFYTANVRDAALAAGRVEPGMTAARSEFSLAHILKFLDANVRPGDQGEAVPARRLAQIDPCIALCALRVSRNMIAGNEFHFAFRHKLMRILATDDPIEINH